MGSAAAVRGRPSVGVYQSSRPWARIRSRTDDAAQLLQSGGNLAEILDNIGRLIRERFKLYGTIRVLSAEGKMSAWVL
ncbi:MAG TPA: hypothetical protein PK781_06540, partial [Terrimesophilobacter sp.]|nr:hypothetical protein [Terrimesophilobacter sp.]